MKAPRTCRCKDWPSGGFLSGDLAMAAIVLWSSGQFCTADIANLLTVGEDQVDRTVRAARDTARQTDMKWRA
ncbi:hypothetical protein NKJ93_02175 [Mesorhizobium sp. M0028]|uniref:hypothetical protein n=1 Tax=Mesorhizobium sp. M0028 TaxID=2956849 RepID=UPI00333A39DB